MQFLLPALSLYLTVMIVFFSVDIYKIVGYAVFFDILFTLIIIGLGAGTYSGLIATAIAGLGVTASLHSIRYIWGYKRWVKVENIHNKSLFRRRYTRQWVYFPKNNERGEFNDYILLQRKNGCYDYARRQD